MVDMRIMRRRLNWYDAARALNENLGRPIPLRCECGDPDCEELVFMDAAEFRETVYCHRGFVYCEQHRRPRPVRRRSA